MDPQSTHEEYLRYLAGVEQLALHAENDIKLPGTWKKTPHPFKQKHTNLYRSENGIWGVATPRNKNEMFSELFIPRMARSLRQYDIHIPIAPTFTFDDGGADTKTMSIILFPSIVAGDGVLFKRMKPYLMHYASTLPFFMWMGDETDRHVANVCMDANNRHNFAEFDFADTDICNIFEAAGLSDKKDTYAGQYLALSYRHIHESDFDVYQSVGPPSFARYPLLREPFNKAMGKITALSENPSRNVLDVVAKDFPVSEFQRKLTEYSLETRLKRMRAFHRAGHFEHRTQEELPKLRKVQERHFVRWRHDF